MKREEDEEDERTGETRKFTNKISTTNLLVISFMICDFVTKPINKTKIVRCHPHNFKQ